MHRTFATPGRVALRMQVAAGEIAIESAETAETTIDLEPLDDAARESLELARISLGEGGDAYDVAVEAPERRGLFGRTPHFRLRVRCPEATSVSARTRSADVRARGRFESFRANTASGDVEVECVDGAVELQTASGDVELQVANGAVRVQTASGDVAIGRARGPLNAHLVSGDLTLADAEGTIEVNTVSGDQTLEAVGAGSLRAESVSGDVRIGVRRGCDVWLDVRSVSGDTSSELEVTDAPTPEGAPLLELRAKTVSGDVQIVRASAPVEPVR